MSSDLKRAVALSLLPRLGAVRFKKLAEAQGGPSAVFKALVAEFVDDYLMEKAEKEIRKAAAQGVRIVPFFDPRYPALLKEIYAPPILLYVKGVLPSPTAAAIAVVGSRDATLYGLRMARRVSMELAEAGVVVASGMARGIDSAAHEGALDAGGVTVAVLGGGLAAMTVPQRKFADRIAAKGAVISEYAMEASFRPGHFPVRNRIISGLARALLVVEAREKSGAMITVAAALEQGRDVFAVPGNADSATSGGTNFLLKQGAAPVTCADDLLEELRLEKPAPRSSPQCAGESVPKQAGRLAPLENKILSFLSSDPVHVDRLIAESGAAVSAAISALSLLEVKGFVRQLPGKSFVKNWRP